MRLNNKGFTLVEVLAVVVIISIMAGIAIPNIISSINIGKDNGVIILKKNIVNGAINMFEEVSSGITIFSYELGGDGPIKKEELVSISEDKIFTNLQTLVSNGYLKGSSGFDSKVLLNPKNGENIGYCTIIITRNRDDDTNKISYVVENASIADESCLGEY